MIRKLRIISVVLFVSFNISYGQEEEDLLSMLESENQAEAFNLPSFKAMKIGNLQSTKVANKGDLYMYVSHRFGTLKNAGSTFFGFDNANTKIQMIYGLFNGVQVGISRESLRRTFASSVKVRLRNQTTQFPVNISFYSTVNLNTDLSKERFPKLRYFDRLSYASQLLISRRLNADFSFQLAPTFVRQNLVLEAFQNHEQFALGMGGRHKLSKRLSVNVDYAYNFSRAEQSIYKNPLTIGIDIETGGHVFQLLFSNAQSTNEPGFISNAEGDWSQGDIFFGFNIVRSF